MVNLKHPKIVDVYSGYFSPEKETFVMINELCDYGALERLIISKREKDQAFPEDIIRRVMMDITSAIEYIHSKDWLHCDMKPENVLVSINGDVKLGDFGISLNLLEKEKQLKTPIGTLK